MSLATTSSSDTCDPTVCGLGGMLHAHCRCGLPMAAGDTRCRLCGLEGRELYCRGRSRRIGHPPDEAYVALLITVLRDEAHARRLRLGDSNARPLRGLMKHRVRGQPWISLASWPASAVHG
jgi:hypothetical protein